MLNHQFLPVHQLSTPQKLKMYDLYSANYNCTQKDMFFEDLSNKQFVILLVDQQLEVQGFSTVSVNPKDCGTDTYNIMFSGDTIIAPEHWGTQELVKGFTETVGRLLASDPEKEWYWFLMSKGHRTYMYLALFFEAYYPHVAHPYPELKQILDKTAPKLFGEYWRPEEDLIIFSESMGELTPELAQGSFDKKRNKHVAFFLEKNPRFYAGEELACIAPLGFKNMHPRIHRYLQKGWEAGIPDFDLVTSK